MGEKKEDIKELSLEEKYSKLNDSFNMLNQQYQMLFEEYKKVTDQAFYKKLDFDFKVLENKDCFEKEFIDSVVKEIQDALTIREEGK